jgi:hypothetical protein
MVHNLGFWVFRGKITNIFSSTYHSTAKYNNHHSYGETALQLMKIYWPLRYLKPCGFDMKSASTFPVYTATYNSNTFEAFTKCQYRIYSPGRQNQKILILPTFSFYSLFLLSFVCVCDYFLLQLNKKKNNELI